VNSCPSQDNNGEGETRSGQPAARRRYIRFSAACELVPFLLGFALSFFRLLASKDAPIEERKFIRKL